MYLKKRPVFSIFKGTVYSKKERKSSNALTAKFRKIIKKPEFSLFQNRFRTSRASVYAGLSLLSRPDSCSPSSARKPNAIPAKMRPGASIKPHHHRKCISPACSRRIYCFQGSKWLLSHRYRSSGPYRKKNICAGRTTLSV